MTAAPPEKPVRLSAHADGYRSRRGFTEAEVVLAIRTNPWLPAQNNRLEATRDFTFDDNWNGKHYGTKRVRPIFVDEPDEIVVVTVYTYFF